MLTSATTNIPADAAEAQNAARELQDTASDDLTPSALAERALGFEGLEVEVGARAASRSNGRPPCPT